MKIPLLFNYENIWFRNIFFLILICFVYFIEFLYGTPIGDYIENPRMEIAAFVLQYFVIFCNNHFLVRSFLMKSSTKLFFISEISLVIFCAILYYYISFHFFEKTSVVSSFISVILTIVIGIGFYFFHTWIIQNTIGLKKKIADNETELSFLKHQLNPHFLLNAMNNLYGVSLSEPEMVSDKILELSDLLRYQLEAIKKSKVLASEELDFCKSYVMYMEYKSSNLKVETTIEGDYETIKIPALLFLPLIENSVKFASENENPILKMSWIFEEDVLTFTIINNFLEKNSKAKGTKIGIENLKRRLEILETKNELKITKNNFFTVQLKLWI